MVKLMSVSEVHRLIKDGLIPKLMINSQGKIDINFKCIQEELIQVETLWASIPEEMRDDPEFKAIRDVIDSIKGVKAKDLLDTYTIKKSHIDLISRGYLAGCCCGLITTGGGKFYTTAVFLGKPNNIKIATKSLKTMNELLGDKCAEVIQRDKTPANMLTAFIDIGTVLGGYEKKLT